MKKLLSLMALAAITIGVSSAALAHCEIPCGIYGDEARFATLEEHILTIEKAMNRIVELSKAGDKNHNQIVRWINTKENHADALREIVTQYFLVQRVKPVPPDQKEAYRKYVGKLTLLHGLLVHAMKAKQTTDLAQVLALRNLLTEFKEAYFHDK